MKKRGRVLIVVAVLFLLLAVNIPAQEDSSGEQAVSLGKRLNDKKTMGLGRVVNAEYSACFLDKGNSCIAGSVENAEIVGKKIGIIVEQVISSDLITGHGEWECDNVGEELSNLGNKGNPLGCFVGIVDEDDDAADDGAVGFAVKGTLLDHSWRSITWADHYPACDDQDAFDLLYNGLFASTAEVRGLKFLCAEDSQWHQCIDDRELTSLTYGSYIHGDQSTLYNCTTTDDVVTWVEIGVDQDHDLVTVEEGDCRDDPTDEPIVCADLESLADCNNLKYASCAVCINPARPETGNDGIDNSCRTGKIEADVFTVNDDPDLPKYKDVCEREYDYSPTSSGINRCCGDDGIKDVGEVIDTESGKYVCLNNNLVKTQMGKSPSEILSAEWDIPAPSQEGMSSEETGSSEWSWISAAGNAKFTIFTINKPGEISTDLVSNGLDWKACSSANEGILASPYELSSQNRFYCSAAGETALWADCSQDQPQDNGVKRRSPGQGVFDLTHFLDELTKTTIQFYSPGIQTVYGKIYGPQNYPSFAGYAYLEVYFKFTNEILPAGANLQLEAWSIDGKIDPQKVLAYAVNGATLEGNKIYHAQIPVVGWKEVTLISLRPTPSSLPFEIINVHLAKKESDPVCAGSVWLSSLDQEDHSIAQGEMCTSLGLTWLGNTVSDPSLRCCGNTAGEYGVGAEKGCWNSQGLEIGKTANNVQVKLMYGNREIISTEQSTKVSAELAETRYGSANLFLELLNSESKCELVNSKVICPDDYFPSNLAYSSRPYIDVKGTNAAPGSTFVRGAVAHPETITITGVVINSGPTKIKEVTFGKTNFFEAALTEIKGGKIYFLDPLHPEDVDEEKTIITSDDLDAEKKLYYLMAKADTSEQTYSYDSSVEEVLTYSCSAATCTFPLKGNAPYTISNQFPQSYDLYFVARNNEGQEMRTFINTPRTVYAKDGWLEVVNLPQQILFEGTAFLGCGDAGHLGKVSFVISQEMCSTQNLEVSGFYCSPQSSWKNDELPTALYDLENNLQFPPDFPPQKPEDRTHSSSIVFGRNLLINPMLDLTK